MAVLEKIRVRMGVFISVVIGVALLSFLVDPSTLQSAIDSFSSKYDVGEMNGKSIGYQAFQQKVDRYTSIQQIITGSSSLDEQASDMVQQRAWQDYMDELVLFPAFKKAGVNLGEEELFDLTQGQEISPVLQQEAVFMDENNQFSRSRLVQFIQNMHSDPNGAAAIYWNYLESGMKQEQLYTKYLSLLSKSVVSTAVEIRRDMEENNVTSTARFIMQPMGFALDTAIRVSGQEIKAYYDKNKHLYEQQASRDIEYVQFTVVPSLLDINRIEAETEKYFREFAESDNLKVFLSRNSDRPFDSRYFKAGELSSISPVLDSFAFKAKMSDVLPITREGDAFFSARITSTRMMPDSAFVEHILLATGSKVADSLVTVLNKGGNMEVLATAHSVLPANDGQKAGELGWMTSEMFGGVLDTCLLAPLNKAFSYTSAYGTHVFRITKRTQLYKKVQLALYEKTAVPGKETFQSFYNEASALAAKSDGKRALFTQAANEKNVPIMPAYGIVPGARTVANINNARELSRWIFEAKKDAVSPVITIDNKYVVVATVVGIHDKGFASVEEKKDEISVELRRQKQMEKMAETLKGQMQGISSIDALGETLGLSVSKQEGIAFGSYGMQQLDPSFIGAVVGAQEQGKLYGPIKGTIGIFAFTLDGRETGAFYTEEDAKQRHIQFSAQQGQMAIYALSRAAKVEDNRVNFY